MRTITIGRSSQCDIVIPDDSVSRVHGELSIVNGRYVYRDMSSNGTTLNGEYISNKAIEITPGASLMLSNRIPFPWGQIYALLPLPNKSHHAYNATGHTVMEPTPQQAQHMTNYNNDQAGIGWCILSFLFPIVGWILYFAWKNQTPTKASTVATCAWVGFAVGIILTFI